MPAGMNIVCVVNTCGWIGTGLVYFLLGFSWYVIVVQIIQSSRWNKWVQGSAAGVYSLIVALTVIAHFNSMTSQPGYISRLTMPPDKDSITTSIQDLDPDMRWCLKCSNYKPPKAHHCSVCKKCIVRMDHHCPWVNNCIGLYNLKYFILFNFYTCLTCILTLTIVIAYVIQCANLRESDSVPFSAGQRRITQLRKPPLGQALQSENLEVCNLSPVRAFSAMMLTIFALIFGVFTVFILTEQVERTMAGDSGEWTPTSDLEARVLVIVVDQYKRQINGIDSSSHRDRIGEQSKLSRMKRLANCMGSEMKILWLLPFLTNRAKVANDVTDRDRLCLSGQYRYLIDGRESTKSAEDDEELNRPVVMNLGIGNPHNCNKAFNEGYYFSQKSSRLKRGQQWQEAEI